MWVSPVSSYQNKNCNNKLLKGNELNSDAGGAKANQWETDNEEEQRTAVYFIAAGLLLNQGNYLQ